jgi:hypothetical protein
MNSADVTVRIVPRVSVVGHPFTEVLYNWFDPDGVNHYACTRYWYVVDDTAHARANEAQQFIKRRKVAI